MLHKTLAKHPELKFLYMKFIQSLNSTQLDSNSPGESWNLYAYVRELCLRYQRFQDLLRDILTFKLFYHLRVEVRNGGAGDKYEREGKGEREMLLCWTYYKRHEFKFSFVVGVDNLMKNFGGCHDAANNNANNNNANNKNGSSNSCANGGNKGLDVKVSHFKFVDFVGNRKNRNSDGEQEQEKVRVVFEEMLDRVSGLSILNKVVF
ncbi:unnamed protein product [Ambrosiozyma monospora]|uniref:Unnamed protein product n=1 Tax=Ambrosiozyma monospora TaxID=43982 RepID=A0ACB5T6R3_AMBMO|nr:unnamed protein product [Ambrosiozyma monospora]